MVLVFTMAVVLTIVLVVAFLRIRSRRILKAKYTAARDEADSVKTSTRPSASPLRQRRYQQELGAADAARIETSRHNLCMAASGIDNPLLPAVVNRNAHLPKNERTNFCQRVAEPFEVSFFRAQCAVLRAQLGDTTWWEWLGGPWLARGLHDSIAAKLLTDATDESRAFCLDMLDAWLLQGTHDQFSALRKELAELEEVATLETLHAREVDAVQSEYSKDWLLVSVLRTLMPTLRRAGVIALRPRRPHCPLCFDTYDPDDTYATRVRLVNFVPCGHWLCGRCFEGNRTSNAGKPDTCVVCNLEALPMDRDWPGAMIDMDTVPTPVARR